MFAEWFEPIQSSALSQALRASVWVYPLVNTGHILGLALLIGAIVPVDLRLLGCWRRVSPAALSLVLLPVAVTGLALAAICGVLLFWARPLDYVDSTLFQFKLALVAAGVVNALALRMGGRWQTAMTSGQWGLGMKLAAILSLLIWLGALIVGRLLGYR